MAIDNNKIVVLCSGGLDSLVTSEIYRRTGYEVSLLYINYRNKNSKEEVSKLIDYATKYNLKYYIEMLSTDFLDKAIEASPSYIPMRNMIFLSVALSLAETIGAGAVAIGVIDVGVYYSDCSEQFIESMNNMGLNMADIKVLAPLINASKDKVYELAKCFNITLEEVYTCEHPNKDGSPCGECSKCVDLERAQAIVLNK